MVESWQTNPSGRLLQMLSINDNLFKINVNQSFHSSVKLYLSSVRTYKFRGEQVKHTKHPVHIYLIYHAADF